ncbi:MAG: FAD-dependent monooxygenase [Armatimonadota bacterium]
MRIAVIGGGPGGLLFAVMMKRADRSHEITVFERNAPDATFGFGVVFPERSFRYLRQADQDTYEAFTRATVSWDAIEYRHRGQVLRCGGHAFFGIARMDLLSILQQQARGLGVDLHFHHDISDLSAVVGYDIVVAADGVNSVVRRDLAEQFRPTVHTGRSKYIWLGTTKVFDALTFIFEESAHGWFGVHIYPYSAEASTFIVESDEGSWRRAGLDRSPDPARTLGQKDVETLEYCERLFARHLEGHSLLANNSKWLSFRTVRNRVWHEGRVVLIGDAAHTAHFSVGSGTRMALEDAIALARALQNHHDPASALEAYERERQPAVRYIQQAAGPSRRWWERFRTWTHFAPEQFAFHHLARTRVLTYGTLTVRDAGFVKTAEAWFAKSIRAPSGNGVSGVNGSPGADGSAERLSPATAPLRLREVLLANRVVAAPSDALAAKNRRPKQRPPAGVEEYAPAGAGLVMMGPVASSTDGRVTVTPARRWSEEHAGTWRLETESLHARTAACIGLQLAVLQPTDATSDRLIDDCVRVAQFAREAAFDLLALDYAAGSSLEARLGCDLLEAVRDAWPAGRPVSVYLAAWENPEDDHAVEAGLALAQALKTRGCDVIAVSVQRGLTGRDPERARAAHAFTSDLIRNVVGVSTMMVGGAYTVGDVNALILSGQTDLCEWPRLAWPGWRPGGDGAAAGT